MAKDDQGAGKSRGWLWLGLGLLAGAGIGGAAYAWKKTSNRYKTQVNGGFKLNGLNDLVEVWRDHWGVPHIYAKNEHDLFYAQGFVQAQDRFWQMEVHRRLGLGKTAAIFGRKTLEIDRFVHRVGIARAAANDLTALDNESAVVLDAYSAGVNAFIKQNKLPIEFSLLGLQPEPWRPLDTLAFIKTFAWSLSSNFDLELTRARLVKRLGARLASKLEPIYPKGQPLVNPPGADYEGASESILKCYVENMLMPMLSEGGGSNNWVVSGSRTQSGKPLLANDPHLPLQIPGLWYEMHLDCPTLKAIGATLPATPTIAIGRNQNIAWGATAAMTDLQDLFIEKFLIDEPHHYFRSGLWREAELVKFSIAVKGEPDHQEEILVTHHGPVIADLPIVTNNQDHHTYKLSLKWTGYEPSNLLGNFLSLNRAKDWSEFRASFQNWAAPGFNMVYADTQGNIGYQLIACPPIRKTGGGTLPLAGWESENDWQGKVPYDEMPSVYNPPDGLIITANNKIVDDDYPYHISSDFVNGYRAERIRELLSNNYKITVEDCRQAQCDFTTIAGREFVKLLLDKILVDDLSPLAKEALKEFNEWQGQATTESIAQTLYQLTLQHLLEKTLGGLLEEDLHDFLGRSEGALAKLNSFTSRFIPTLIKMIKDNDETLLRELPTTHNWNELLQGSFEHVVAQLSKRFGANPKLWQWKKFHFINFEHPFGKANRAMQLLFNRGPYPLGGDVETPAQMAFPALGNAQGGFEVTGWAVSYRQIIDLGDLGNSWMCPATGQSGSPFSKHYDDLIKLWVNNELHPMLFEKERVLEFSEGKLLLLPVETHQAQLTVGA
ncbi:MAG: penicillin acylase family protein [Acidobacteria bacterium]|nr:penicillin acylase family protein [Acidobacteriota bacterium]